MEEQTGNEKILSILGLRKLPESKTQDTHDSRKMYIRDERGLEENTSSVQERRGKCTTRIERTQRTAVEEEVEGVKSN